MPIIVGSSTSTTVTTPGERLVLDGLDLNDGTVFGLIELSCPPPPPKAQWVGGADSENDALISDPNRENRTVTARIGVIPTGDMDTALARIASVVDKLRAASQTETGVELVWTPAASSRTGTFDVLSGQVTDLPITYDTLWFSQAPEFTIEMTAKPGMRLPPIEPFTDLFTTDTIADYTFDLGDGTMAVSGSALRASTTSTKRLWRSAQPYRMTSFQVTLRYRTGTAVTGGGLQIAAMFRVDAANYIYARLSSAATSLILSKSEAGILSTLGSSTSAFTVLAASTTYWLRARKDGNTFTWEHWTTDPDLTSTPAASQSYTLTGTDATNFGEGVEMDAGVIMTPPDTSWFLGDFQIDPYIFTSSTPFVAGSVNVPGDLPAIGVLTVTDKASQTRRHLEWGVEGAGTYTPGTSLLIDSDDMVTTGFSGNQTTIDGYDPNGTGTTEVGAAVYPTTVAVCGLGNQTHTGVFRVKARLKAETAGSVNFRLSWKAGDGPMSANPWVTPQSDFTWEEHDLGTITIPAGSGRWTGQIEAFLTAGVAAPGGGYVDYLVLVPAAAGYGKARAEYAYHAGVLGDFDDFTTTTAGGALNGRFAPVGSATWATSGAAGDFTFEDYGGGENIVSAASTSNPRYAILGSTSYTDVEVSARVLRDYLNPGLGDVTGVSAVVARWASSTNHLRAELTTRPRFRLVKVVAGVTKVLAYVDVSPTLQNTWLRVRLIAYATGFAVAQLTDATGNIIETLTASDTVLATGGTLATGNIGVADINNGNTSNLRSRFDEISRSVPAAEPVVIYSGRSLTINGSLVQRLDSTGTYTGRPPSYRGSRFAFPVGTGRVLAKARRTDIDATTDVTVTDATGLTVAVYPRSLVVPRND